MILFSVIIVGRGRIPSTDQSEGRVHGHVKLVAMSSKVWPQNKATSKAEYTNTQQGLPD
jgi:hypothetical protein